MSHRGSSDPPYYRLPGLPYAVDALEPHLSRDTLAGHWGKHHRGDIDRLNDLVRHSELEGLPLEELIRHAKGAVLNHAAEAWNHAFYWNCLTPNARRRPDGPLDAAIDARFGSFERFRGVFTRSATGKFGAGWVWLSRTAQGKLVVEATDNADNPIAQGHTPLLGCDVWEHAYYIDYRNERARYLEAFWALVDWDFVARRFAG
jgi:Fe-Mn family superoxide dismutase